MFKNKEGKEDVKADKKAPKKKSAEPKVSKKAEAFQDPKGERKVFSKHPSERRAYLLIGERKYRTTYQIKRDTREELVAIPGRTLKLEDWLSGKEDLGLAS